MNHMTFPLSSADISRLSPEISKFWYMEKYRYRLRFDTYFLILLTFFESLKTILINMVAILMMSAKVATLGLLKKKMFWNNGYGIITSFHDITNKIFSGESNHIVGGIMCPKSGNSSISMREVIITSIL